MKRLAQALLFAAMVMIVVVGCAGTQFSERKDYQDMTVIQGGRTGAFGTDNSWWYIQEKQKEQPDIMRLQETYSRTAEITDQGCPDPAQTKNIRREKIKEVHTRDIANPNKRAPVAFGGGGTNPSTGNVLLPAAVQAAGFVGGNMVAPGTSIAVQGATSIAKGGSSSSKATGGSSTATGGSSNATGGAGGSSTSTSKVSSSQTSVNSNSNSNTNTSSSSNSNTNANSN